MRPFFKYYWEGAEFDSGALAFYGMPIVNVRAAPTTGTTVYDFTTVTTVHGFSDVTAETLLANGHEVPVTPTFAEWKYAIDRKQRCRHCWAITRTAADHARHLEFQHRSMVRT